MGWLEEEEDDRPPRAKQHWPQPQSCDTWGDGWQWEMESLEAQSQYLFVAWNILFTIIPAPYFTKQFTNKGKLKRASEFQEKFPMVLHVLSNFLRLKKNFKVASSLGKFRTINSEIMMLGRDWTYETGRRLFLAIMDLLETLGHNVAQDHAK